MKQVSLAGGTSTTVHDLFIPAAAAEGRLVVKGYLWQLFYGVNTQYSLNTIFVVFIPELSLCTKHSLKYWNDPQNSECAPTGALKPGTVNN